MTSVIPPAETVAGSQEHPSLFQRLIAVFVRPAHAWSGLDRRAEWWFPLILTLVVSLGTSALLYHRSLIPMIVDQWEQQVAAGNMASEQFEKAEAFMSSGAGMAVTLGQQAVVLVLATLFIGLLVWFGVGFVLGSGMRFRPALEVAAWSGLVTLPGALLAAALAWGRETYKGVHVGFALLLPENDPPQRLLTALGVILDALGPLSIWYLVVGILGAASLSRVPLKSVAWVLAGIYLVTVLLFAALGAMFVPAS